MSVRILHVLPHRGGGAETYIDMLERLPGFEHERIYLSAGRTPASAVTSIPAGWPNLATSMRSADLLHTHGDVASAIALPRDHGTPAVMTTHGLHMLRRSRGLARALMHRATRQVARRARMVCCTSVSERDELATILAPPDRDKLRVIHNGIDVVPTVSGLERISLRNALGVEPGSVLALFVGQLEPRKAPLIAAHAARHARVAGAPVVLAVAGDGPQAPHVHALAGDSVKPLGYRSDLHRVFPAADIFVQPSEREGLSLALLEAMGHGLPVLAADGPGNSEAVGDAGVLFAPGDVIGLAGALARLSMDSGVREDLGSRARSRAVARFSASRFLADTEDMYWCSLPESRRLSQDAAHRALDRKRRDVRDAVGQQAGDALDTAAPAHRPRSHDNRLGDLLAFARGRNVA
jgi:glycosyltransferase involved in cell wall biosynthesis